VTKEKVFSIFHDSFQNFSNTKDFADCSPAPNVEFGFAPHKWREALNASRFMIR
jgi:hypothetical protein